MTLKEFMGTYAYKVSEEVSIIGMDGQELDGEIKDFLEETVIDYHVGSCGYLEIELDI